jgi:hypothetical protein
MGNLYVESLQALECGFLDTVDIEPYMQTICQSLKRQIPQKLKCETLECMIQGYSYMDKCCVCPSCGEFRGNLDYEPFKIKKYSFCPDCGQALDWSDIKA